MDSKLILKSSTKVPLSERFAKIHGRMNERPTSSTSLRDRNSSGKYYNPLSVTLKRGANSSRKTMGSSRQGGLRYRVGEKQITGGEASPRIRTPNKTNYIQKEFVQPRGGAARGGFQRGGYQSRGAQNNSNFKSSTNTFQGATWNNPKNKPFVRRPLPSPKKEDLDKDLEKYMSRTKGYLDDQLDEYHKQV